MRLFLGLDIGGTKTAAVLRTAGGQVVARTWIEHVDREGTVQERLLHAIAAMRDAAGDATIDACQVAVAGLISADGRTVVRGAGLGLTGVPLADELRAASGLPVRIVNDAEATLVGHLGHVGGDRADGTRVLLTVGTSLGGAISIDGAVVRGAHGFAGELGHITVDYENDRTCVCGATGCVQNYASGRGIVAMAIEHGVLDPDRNDPALGRYVVERAATDERAAAVLHRAGLMLGRAVVQLGVVLDPDEVLVGGSLGHAAGHVLLAGAAQEIEARWPFADIRARPTIRPESAGPYAAALGAAALATIPHKEA